MPKSKIKNHDARSLAVHILQQVHKNIPLQSALDSALTKHPISSKETALCTELVYGYARYCLRLNYVLDTLLKKREQLPLPLQITLGISAYSLLFLSRVPHYATVNWAVDFTKSQFGPGLAKLCNGVLRSLLRLGDAPLHDNFYKNAHDFYSVPQWIYDLWYNEYGENNAQLLLTKSLQKPMQCIRLNRLHADYKELHSFFSSVEGANAVGFDGFVFNEGASHAWPHALKGKSLSEWHNEGAFSWQAAGSQIALSKCFEAVPRLHEQEWWDACAGQGGKSFALMEQGINVGLVSDVSSVRVAQFKRTAQRLNVPMPRLALMSGVRPALCSWSGSILLDVPCSGLGTLSRRPDIRLHRTKNDVKNMLKTQASILQSTWPLLQKSNYVLYMTCTLNPQENEGQVNAFLRDHADAHMLFTWQTPFEHPWLEGMYVAVIQKA